MSDAAPAPSPASASVPESPGTNRAMLEALVCPVTQGRLSYDPARQELLSHTARLAFPIRRGIPILLASEAREIDD